PYVHDEHCGACGVGCAGAIPNATAGCVLTGATARCEVAECDLGYYKAGPLTCLPLGDSLFTPCQTDANFVNPGDRCLALDGGAFCGRSCAEGNLYGLPAGDCPEGFTCADLGGGVHQCQPVTASCSCLGDGDVGKSRTCIVSNDAGTCY